LLGLNGQPIQFIPLFALPGLSTGAILLQAELTNFGQGTVTVEIVSLTDQSILAEATATLFAVPASNPMLTLAPVDAIDENDLAELNGSLADVAGQGTLTLALDWGDASSPDDEQSFSLGATPLSKAADGIDWDPATFAFSIDHRYLDDNPTDTVQDSYAITATITVDQTSAGDVATQSVLVHNVDPVIHTFGSDSPCDCKTTPGEVVTVTGEFTDVGTLDSHTGQIAWGDGTTSDILIDAVNGSFTSTHVFATGGIFNIEAMLQDDDGGSATATTTLAVTGVRLTTDGVLEIVGTAGKDIVVVKQLGGSGGGSDGGSDGGRDHKSKGGSDGGSDNKKHRGGSDGGSDTSLINVTANFDVGGGSHGGSDGHSDGGSDAGADTHYFDVDLVHWMVAADWTS